MMKVPEPGLDVHLALELHDAQGGAETKYYSLEPQIQKVGQWDFATFNLPVDSAMRTARLFKIFVYSPTEKAVCLKHMDVSFRPAYLKPGVKGQSMK